jgi:hypothetical protein
MRMKDNTPSGPRIHRIRSRKAVLGLIMLQAGVAAGAATLVSIDPGVEQHAITAMSMGTNLVYSWHPDTFFADGEVAHIVKDIGIGALRWPGGTVTTFYHWDALIGHGWNDGWNPSWDPASNLPPEEFMDLGEYLALIDQTGAEIMLGVNMSSGKEWNREAEGIAEATALMAHCQSMGYDVKYIYFDNESYHEGNNYNRDDDGDGEAWTAASYAESFASYAAAVKTVYPDAKLIANWKANPGSSVFQTNMQTMFSIAGDVIDYVDLHYYWEWGTASWDLWKSQKPMLKKGTSKTYGEDVEEANAVFAGLGYPHIRTAVLEWNIAPGPWETDPAHSHFKTALMQAEMQMQLLQGGLDIGMLYTLESPLVDFNTTKHIIQGNEATATALWMWLFAKAGGKTVVQASSNRAGVSAVVLKGGTGELVVYLLNKSDADETVTLGLSGYTLTDVSEAWRFHDDGSGLGALQTIGLWESGGQLRTTLRADSLNMIGLAYPSVDPPAVPQTAIEVYQPIPASILAAWDTSAGAPDLPVTGVEASLGGSYHELDTTAGSTDGSFGATLPGAETALSCFSVRMENARNSVSLQIVNRSGNPLQLDSVHFDYAPWWVKSPKDVALVYAGGDLDGIANGTILQSATELVNLGTKKGDYYDFDWSLEALADRILDHNEAAVFNLVVSNAAPDGAWANGAFYNIAIYGRSVTASGNALVLSWRAETGKKYTLFDSTTLQPGDWQSASGTLIGRPGDMSVSSRMDLNPHFLRLQVEP